jgi:hypothetical protein
MLGFLIIIYTIRLIRFRKYFILYTMAELTEAIDYASIAEEKIQMILRQTDYSYAVACQKLAFNNNDVMAVIRSYLKEGLVVVDAPVVKPLSMNQQIYKEIRTLMDETDPK